MQNDVNIEWWEEADPEQAQLASSTRAWRAYLVESRERDGRACLRPPSWPGSLYKHLTLSSAGVVWATGTREQLTRDPMACSSGCDQ